MKKSNEYINYYKSLVNTIDEFNQSYKGNTFQAIGHGAASGIAIPFILIFGGITLLFIWLYDKIFNKKTLLRWNCPVCNYERVKWEQKKCPSCNTNLNWPSENKKAASK